MDPKKDIVEAVITTLIFGVKSSAAQTEAAVLKLADLIEDENPILADTLRNGRFVDDLADSHMSVDECMKTMESANELFQKFGLECKGWAITGAKPSEEISADGQTLMVGGLKFKPELDCLEVLVSPLHFGSKSGED